MTSDGINGPDWAQVELLAAEVARHMEEWSTEPAAAATRRLLEYLDELEKGYGKRASISATRADYLDDLDDRLRNLQEAYALAVASDDAPNRTFIASSLAQLFIEDVGDYVSGARWLAELAEALNNHWDVGEHEEYLRLQGIISEKSE